MRLKKRYSNIFYYFRGPQLKENERETQLENNLTKALVNTMQYCKSFNDNFLEEIFGLKNETEIMFDMQKKPSEYLKNQKKKYVVLIRSESNHSEKKGKKYKNGSTADAIISNKHFIISVEAKVRASKETNQLESQKEQLKTNIYKEITWQEIYSLASALKLKKTESGYFIYNQFVKYLEIMEFGKFSGFEKEDFENIKNSEDKHYLKNKLDSLLLAIVKKYNTKYESNVGNLDEKKDLVWGVIINKRFGVKNKVYHPHFGFFMYDNRLEFCLNFESKHLANKFIKKLEKNDYLQEKILGLKDYEFCLLERKERQVQKYDSKEKNSSKLSDMTKSKLKIYLEDGKALNRKEQGKICCPRFLIKYIYDVKTKFEILSNKNKLVNDIVKRISETEDILNFF